MFFIKTSIKKYVRHKSNIYIWRTHAWRLLENERILKKVEKFCEKGHFDKIPHGALQLKLLGARQGTEEGFFFNHEKKILV